MAVELGQVIATCYDLAHGANGAIIGRGNPDSVRQLVEIHRGVTGHEDEVIESLGEYHLAQAVADEHLAGTNSQE